MSDELDLRWRKVSEHGQPDEATCPWGCRYRTPCGVSERLATAAIELLPHVEWQPLPPPCDDVMPPPEPKGRWVSSFGSIWPRGLPPLTEVDEAARILNTYDRDGAVLRARDWQEAPDDDTPVLRWAGDGWSWAKATGRVVRHYRSPWAAMPPGPGEVKG